MISFSEIDTTVKRATRAVGFSWGISEEIGKNIRLLEMFGLPGIKNINEYYKVYKINKFEDIKVISKSNFSKGYYCPILAGVNFFDQSYSILEFQTQFEPHNSLLLRFYDFHFDLFAPHLYCN